MRLFVFFSCLFYFIQNVYSQPVKRTPCIVDISHVAINARIYSNIFNDFGWLNPEVSARKFSFSEGGYFFMMNGSAFQLNKFDENSMRLQGRGTASLVMKELSDSNSYYDVRVLSKKLRTTQKWIATKPQKWEWQTVQDSFLEIPSYYSYSFHVHDNMIVTVYEVKKTKGETEYFIQNSSYLMAINEKGINYILLDADGNGSFTDLTDKILFNSWNPYLHESAYKPVDGFKENTWYDQSYLYYTYFLNVLYQNGKLTIRCENDYYANQAQTGIISFTKLPKKSTLFINDSIYPYTQSSFSIPAEFGMHKATISRKGYINVEHVFTLNEVRLKEDITYPKKVFPAGELLLKNIFSEHYFVTIHYPNGTEHIYYNTPSFTLLPGEYSLTVNMNGYNLSFPIKIVKNKTSEMDIKEEVNKVGTN